MVSICSLFRRQVALLLASMALAQLLGCAVDRGGGRYESAPQVVVDAAALAPSREEACRRSAGKAVDDHLLSARTAGMLPQDFAAIRGAVRSMGIMATFRDSNPACLPHLAAGVQSKPHDLLQKSWDESNLLSEDRHLAGLISDKTVRPPKGEKVSNPRLTFYRGEPVTCDYDLMDLIEADGRRIAGESSRELEIRGGINRAIPPTPRGHRDRVMHGSQAGYGDYLRMHPEEKPLPRLYRPESPLTAFSQDGTVYRLESISDVLNYYLCINAGLAPEWDVELEKSEGGRLRLH